MKICYIAHPISGDLEKNLADIRRIVRKINLTLDHIVPFVPYYADCVSMVDSLPNERERGIRNDIYLLSSGFVNELWLTGDVLSSGMRAEMELAGGLGIEVIDLIGKL